jgi:hypothetical protein
MFFEIIRELSQDDMGKILEFVTGASKAPAEGFKSYAKSGPPFKISPDEFNHNHPVAHTCTRRLALPTYKTKAEMKENLLLAAELSRALGFDMA